MAGAPETVRLGKAIEAEIETYTASGPGRFQQYGSLYRDLWTLLETGADSQRLRQCSPRAARLIRQLLQRMEKAQSNSLRKAIYDVARYEAGFEGACRHWGVRTAELKYVDGLAKYCGGWLGQLQLVEGSDRSRQSWIAEVDEERELIDVFVGDRAYQDIVLATLEAGRVPRRRGRLGTEVYGLCFGHRQSEDFRFRRALHTLLTFRMERFAPQLRAEAGSAFVYPNDRSSAIQIEAARRSFPYLEVIGDFHSHVWPSHREMMVETGWTWSGHDERDIPRFVSEMQKYGWNPRILLIAGISPRAKRVNPGYLGSGNVFRETLGPAHIVLSAHRIKTDHTLTDT